MNRRVDGSRQALKLEATEGAAKGVGLWRESDGLDQAAIS